MIKRHGGVMQISANDLGAVCFEFGWQATVGNWPGCLEIQCSARFLQAVWTKADFGEIAIREFVSDFCGSVGTQIHQTLGFWQLAASRQVNSGDDALANGLFDIKFGHDRTPVQVVGIAATRFSP
tara:strand:+ start:4143 stop:4517 length:375 start_codon:yes stop_codon:yes gene_type:complete